MVVSEHMFVYSEHMFVELMFAEQLFVVKDLIKKCHIALRGSEYAEHTQLQPQITRKLQ